MRIASTLRAATSAILIGAAMSCAMTMTARAQAEQAPTGDPALAEREARRAEHARELQALEEAAKVASQARERIEAEVASLRQDRAKITEALIATGERVKAAESKAAAAERRLSTLRGTEDAIRASLAGRRAVIVEVLAALQRMERRPPPAVLARPEDVLGAVRAAILLGAVVPELRNEAQILAADLEEMVRLRDASVLEREQVTKDLANLAEERTRLTALTEARRTALASAEETAEAERKRLAGIVAKATDLRDLIEALDKDISQASRAAEEARRQIETQTREVREKFAAAAFKDPTRLAPKVAFSELRGLLPLPVAGRALRGYGTDDGFGGSARGVSFVTRSRAVVTAPTDAWVSFAGPFRSFGQLLILNTGNGFYLLLAGMERIDVELGRFVLAGEPVGMMGASAAPASSSLSGDTNGPVLYVEFRKDGTSIDPGPWWQRQAGDQKTGSLAPLQSLGEKVRG